MNKRLSLSITPTCSTSSGLANRRRNNKNLSLCLSPESSSQLLHVTQLQQPKQQQDDVNAYSSGPAKIMPFLYLGSEKNTLDLDYLKQLNVQAILNVAAEVNNPYEYMFQPMDDLLPSSVVPSPSLSKASSVSSTASSIQTILDSPQQQQQQRQQYIAYQKLSWQHNQDNLAAELSKAIDIIDRARNAGQTILVHCQCGVARSASVIIAYIMKTYNMPMQDAYNHVKKLAPPISPNLGLLFQLREFEQKIRPTMVLPEQHYQPPPTPTVFTAPQVQQPQEQQPCVVTERNHSHSDRPKSWIASPPSIITASPSEFTLKQNKKNTFLMRASSLCLTSAWKRRLKTKPTQKTDSQPQQPQQQQPQQEEDGWWKSKKVSLDTTTSVY
ncbi:protein-tyrosine phosphatase-like protein [Parasitella parasitica]|nr:protein-tyrosine phosphatase-like protein [Parasitella parasitica]